MLLGTSGCMRVRVHAGLFGCQAVAVLFVESGLRCVDGDGGRGGDLGWMGCGASRRLVLVAASGAGWLSRVGTALHMGGCENDFEYSGNDLKENRGLWGCHRLFVGNSTSCVSVMSIWTDMSLGRSSGWTS